MNYRDALAWLYGTQAFGIKLGLDNARRLFVAAGNPRDRLRFLHVAGTNGKGSTCAVMDAVLRAGGMRCGLYTSPHLVDFRERIRLDGAMIPEAAVAEGLGLLRECSSMWDHAPTFFELTTALAAWWFAREGADIVVWETGMGGRLDATNVVTPLVSVITPVGLDHQQWLGNSLGAIAMEKAGIIKPGIPVVSAPQETEVREVLEARAREVGASVRFVEAPCELSVGLAGAHQRWNAAVALAALDAASLMPDVETCARGLASVQWPARFQRIGGNLVIDGAHNVPAARALVAAWREVFGDTKARLVFGALCDKNPEELLRELRDIADEVVLVPVNSGRAAATAELRAAAEKLGFAATSESSLACALKSCGRRPVLVTGSLFLAGEALALLEGKAQPAASSQ
ncbi:MAG: bifunctional folylpolyglutamate synthase/dihydrofolate synthase [Chthoniobacterales bacterium]|nr:bifunctional folylpolyglutamate synthase/dihydrofolate synthase [Chthoniobacterales bacterium]